MRGQDSPYIADVANHRPTTSALMPTPPHFPLDDLIADSVSAVRMSAIKEMAMLSARVEDAASLTWGVPSFRTPEYIREAIKQQLDLDPDIGKYALPDGLPELRNLAAQHYREQTGNEVDPDDNVMITAGNTQGLSNLFHAVINPGDEVILTDPGFASHIQQIKLCGGTPVYWTLDEANGWELDPDALPDLITPRTKAIVIVSPSNPTGKIFGREELARLGEIAIQHGLLVFVDDPYGAFTYEHRQRYYNLACMPGLGDHLVYFFTFSKAYAMSGWRLAYTILPAILKRQVLKIHDLTIISAPRVSQVAGITALSSPPDHIRDFQATLLRRRKLLCERLDQVPELFEYNRPEGAYYLFPRIVAEHQDSMEFALRLLNQARVTVTPGGAFGPSGEHHVRLAYCVEDATINLAFDRIEEWLERG